MIENKREFENITEFKDKLNSLRMNIVIYNDSFSVARHNKQNKEAQQFYSQMVEAEAEIEQLKEDYPEYVL